MDQASEKWHKWRGAGIGSSDAPVIMGYEQYLTKHQLCLEKMGVWKRPEAGYAAEFGHMYEPQARARFNLIHDLDIKPECVEHSEFKYLRASLDGADLDKRVFVEIKYMGEKNFQWCRENKKPLEHHHAQLQHQFLTTGFERAFYIPYTLTEDKRQIKEIEYILIVPDRSYIEKELFPAEQEFWSRVVNQEPPPLGPNDEKMVKEKSVIVLADELLKSRIEIKKLEARNDEIEKELKKISNHPVVNFGGKLKLIRYFRKGSVDYAKVPQLKGVDLEPYRKSSSSVESFKPC